MASHPTSDQEFTLEDVDQSVNQVKKSLHWTQAWLFTSIQVGISPEKVDFDRRVMRKYSTYFNNFSLPTISYAEQFQTTTDRLLHLTKEEAKMLDWIVGWCHEPIDDGAQLYEVNKTLTMDQWCYIWSLTGALHIPELRELTLEAVRHKCDHEELSPPHTSVKYLYDLQHNHDTDKQSLWDEFVAQHCIFPANAVSRSNSRSFVQAFVDDVIRARKLIRACDKDLDVAGGDG